MPWNGSGTFTRIYSWVTDAANGINITASRMDADTNDIVNSGLDNALTRDGQGVPTANLPMANFRHTGVGNGVARTDYAALGQVQDASFQAGGTSTGAAGVFAISLTPAITAYAAGLCVSFITHQAAAGADTLNINGVGAKPFVKGTSTAIIANEFTTAQEIYALYDTGGGGRFILITQPQASLILAAGAGTAGVPLVSGGAGAPWAWGSVTGTGAFILATSPAFAGIPTTPTAAAADNSLQVANTAWVRQATGSANLGMIQAFAFGTQLSPGV